MERRKVPLTYLEGRCFAHGGESPSTLVPCLVATAPPFDSNPLHPFPTPSAHITLYYNDNINNLYLLHPGQYCSDESGEETTNLEEETMTILNGCGRLAEAGSEGKDRYCYEVIFAPTVLS